MKEQDKTPEKQLNEVEIGNLPEKEFRIMIMKMIQTPSCESTRITTGCWTIIDRKTLDFTKEDTPRPRTEEKPQ